MEFLRDMGERDGLSRLFVLFYRARESTSAEKGEENDGEEWQCGVAARLESNSLDNLAWRFASGGQSIQLI